MPQLKATRSELLRLKKRLQAAKRGQELLQQKLDVLLIELSKYVREYVEQSKKVSFSLREVYNAVMTIKVFSNQQSFYNFVNLMRGALEAEVTFNSVMGISFPQIVISQKNSFTNFYSTVLNLLPTSENVFYETEKVITALIKLIELQQIILALAEAVRSTKIRVNSLKYYVIPSMERAILFISLRISEMEREEFYRIKKIKSKISKSEMSL
ncbi:MAG: V-type ATP synthase subunit D [Nitrososphaeria archaeon]|nr:V-type ATP synthase subunit D [Nitrososphaeria archaeon]